MSVLYEIKKLLSVKAIWIIYLLLVAYFIIMLFNFPRSSEIEFAKQFVRNHGDGPYEIRLLYDYKTMREEIESCRVNYQIDIEECDRILSVESKALRDLYPNLSYQELWMETSFLDYSEKLYDVERLNQIIEQQNQIEKNGIEAYFYQKMLDYHVVNPRMFDLEKGEVYLVHGYLNVYVNTSILTGGMFAILMIIFAISSSFSYDSSHIDSILLTTKTGRKIILSKLYANIFFSLIISVLCFLPLMIQNVIQKRWDLFFNSKMLTPSLQFLHWFDFTVLQYLMFVLLIAFVANVFCALITFVISIYSKKLVNIISYNLFILSLVIGFLYHYDASGSGTYFSQLIRILIYHTPYGFIYMNEGLFSYYVYNSETYLSYREYPFIFIILNGLFIGLMVVFATRYYKKMNL